MRASGVGGRGSSFRCLHRAVRRPPRARGGCPNRHAPRDKGLLFPPARLPSAMRPRGPRPPKSAPRVSKMAKRSSQHFLARVILELESTTPAVRPFAHTPRDLPGPTWSDLVASDWRKSPFTGGIFWIFAFAERKSAPGLTSTPRPASAALPEAARTCRSRVEVSRERRGGAAREPRDSRVGGSVETLRATSKGRRRFLFGVRGGLTNPRFRRGARRPTRRRRETSDRRGRDVERAEAPGARQRRGGELVGARGWRSESRRAANGRGREARTQVRYRYLPLNAPRRGGGARTSQATPRAQGAPARPPRGALACPRCTHRRQARPGTRTGMSAGVRPRLPRALALSTSFSCTAATRPARKAD